MNPKLVVQWVRLLVPGLTMNPIRRNRKPPTNHAKNQNRLNPNQPGNTLIHGRISGRFPI